MYLLHSCLKWTQFDDSFLFWLQAAAYVHDCVMSSIEGELTSVARALPSDWAPMTGNTQLFEVDLQDATLGSIVTAVQKTGVEVVKVTRSADKAWTHLFLTKNLALMGTKAASAMYNCLSWQDSTLGGIVSAVQETDVELVKVTNLLQSICLAQTCLQTDCYKWTTKSEWAVLLRDPAVFVYGMNAFLCCRRTFEALLLASTAAQNWSKCVSLWAENASFSFKNCSFSFLKHKCSWILTTMACHCRRTAFRI